MISWGGTYGATRSAVQKMVNDGKKVGLAHIKYISPMARNLEAVIGKFKKVVVAELNQGQMRGIINGQYGCNAAGVNKLQGLPFKVSDLVEQFSALL